MTATPVLGATELVAAQAIPEQSVNEAFRLLEQGAQQFAVLDKDLTTPPGGTPADGAAYIVAASPTGAWAGKAKNIAYYQTGTGWLFIAPHEGMRADVADEDTEYRYDGSSWVVVSAGSLGGATLDTDGTFAANSDTRIPSQKAVKTYVDAAVVGLLDYKCAIDCSANPNYPSALKGDSYVVSVAGKIGGASGQTVEAGDFIFAKADNAGGTEASVGSSWDILQYNQLARTRVISAAIIGSALTSSEVLLAVTPPSGETWTFAGNMAGASGKKLSGGTNPASSYALDVKKNGSSVGTITISTGGVVSFTTSGGSSFTLTGGSDELQIVGPASTDTALGYAFAIPASY